MKIYRKYTDNAAVCIVHWSENSSDNFIGDKLHVS